MPGWRLGKSDRSDLKEIFPIEEVPLEVRSDRKRDVLSACLEVLERTEMPQRVGRRKDSKEDLMRRMIPILDAFDNILKYSSTLNLEEDEVLANWFKAIKAVYRHLQLALEREGLSAIKSLGQKLDLTHHDVMDVREDSSVEDNTIVEEVEKGYQYKDRILRDSRVIVARSPRD
ncbi:MAG TPA: nucleotide exchange factor GrpE [bacterium]|nr:nucleotide exchange factor GrpE [bacterium]HQP97212.1 nucleotide exchange factor GrpE [bacterium]